MISKIILKTKRENMPSITVSFKKSSHDIDVDTYIGTLRSLSVIAKEVNYKLSNRSDIQLNVVAQKEGSFEAIIEVASVAGPIALQAAPEILQTINLKRNTASSIACIYRKVTQS